MAAPATSVVVLDRGNNTTCTVNLHGEYVPGVYEGQGGRVRRAPGCGCRGGGAEPGVQVTGGGREPEPPARDFGLVVWRVFCHLFERPGLTKQRKLRKMQDLCRALGFGSNEGG